MWENALDEKNHVVLLQSMRFVIHLGSIFVFANEKPQSSNALTSIPLFFEGLHGLSLINSQRPPYINDFNDYIYFQKLITGVRTCAGCLMISLLESEDSTVISKILRFQIPSEQLQFRFPLELLDLASQVYTVGFTFSKKAPLIDSTSERAKISSKQILQIWGWLQKCLAHPELRKVTWIDLKVG